MSYSTSDHNDTQLADLLRSTAEAAIAYLSSVGDRPVDAVATTAEIRRRLPGTFPDRGEAATDVLKHMIADFDDGLVASAGGRFYGWVVGGSHPAAVAADWLTSSWDQLATMVDSSPAAAAAERTSLAWLLDVLDLPRSASAAFVTGAQMANFTGLAAARHALLRDVGWDVERDGLFGAPPITVLAGRERHVTIDSALRYLGFGTGSVTPVDVDSQGRMEPAAFARLIAQVDGPLIVCMGAGNVNTGAFDPFAELIPLARHHGAWVHIDGAFGLWAASSPIYRGLTAGAKLADSWAVDLHKWLNVPYDSAVVAVRDRRAHAAALSVVANYVMSASDDVAGFHLAPEFSRRARAFPAYATLRTLGRAGVAALVDRCCALARDCATLLGDIPGITICNDVVLNQVLVRFANPDATNQILAAVRSSGEAFLTASTWQGQPVMRVAVSNWQTTRDDVARMAAAVRQAVLASSQSE